MATNDVKTTKTVINQQTDLTTNLQDIVSVDAANDQRITAIVVSGDDTSAQVFQLAVHDGANAYVIEQIPIPVTAGQHAAGTTRAVDILSFLHCTFDNAGNKYYNLAAGHKLQAKMIAITGGKVNRCFVRGAKYD